jgi:class 3 adenylate cyclase
MRLCPRCADQNPDRARFCLACGSPLGQAAQVREVRKTVTIVFCDLVGSTELGESLDAETLRRVLQSYLSAVREALLRHGGTVEKFIGDAVMAVFGIPVLHEDDALRAARAALDMTAAVADLNPELHRLFGVTLQVRIGVNTGEVVASDGTDGQGFATGDAVNLAARLEQAAAPGDVVIGERTYALVRNAVHVEPLDPIRVKGKVAPVSWYRLLAVPDASLSVSYRAASTFIGRGPELAMLQDAYVRAVESQSCQQVTVYGPAGVGKSRLIETFLSAVSSEAIVLTGRCLAYGRGITFWPVREMLHAAAGWTGQESAQRARDMLADLMPGEPDGELIADRIAALLGFTEGTGSIEEAFWAVRKLLEYLARWRPVVLMFDDVHWAEPTLLNLLDHIADYARNAPILLVCSARPDLTDIHPDRKLRGQKVFLEPLTDRETELLVLDVLGAASMDSRVRSRVLGVAEGNPLFAEQIIAMLVDQGVLALRGDTWVAVREVGDDMVPASINALLSARLELLPRSEQLEIQAGAVVGRVFWGGAVAGLTRETLGPTAGNHLPGLVSRDLIQPDTSTLVNEDAYRFQHILIRDAAYAAMPKSTRSSAHRRFAAWLESAAGRRSGEYEDILGFHLEQAFQLLAQLGTVGEEELSLARRAGAFLSSAGSKAFARGDISATVSLLSRAHDLLASQPAAQLEGVPALAESLRWSGDMARAETVLREAQELLNAEESPGTAMHIRLALAELQRVTEPEPGRQERDQTFREAVELFTTHNDRIGLAKAWHLIGTERFDNGHAREAESAWQNAKAHGQQAGAPQLVGDVTMCLAGAGVWGPTPVTEALHRFDEVGADIAGQPYREAFLLRGRSSLEAMRGDFEAARRLIHRGRLILRDLGLTYSEATMGCADYDLALRVGDLGAAEPALRADDAILENIGERWVRSTVTAQLAHTLHSLGDTSAAEHHAELSRELASANDVWSEVLWKSALAKVRATQGNATEARKYATSAVIRAAETDWLCMHADALMDLADVSRLTGDVHGAAAAVGDARLLYEKKGDLASLARTTGFWRGLESAPS